MTLEMLTVRSKRGIMQPTDLGLDVCWNCGRFFENPKAKPYLEGTCPTCTARFKMLSWSQYPPTAQYHSTCHCFNALGGIT